jgi:phosphatidylserine decarboxylase
MDMIAKGGYNWILGTLLCASAALLLFLLIEQIMFIGISVLLLLADCIFLLFFRDPKRQAGRGIVSPADGRIISISSSKTEVELRNSHNKTGKKSNQNKYTDKSHRKSKIKATRVAIFMSPFNVHVNRSPLAGTVLATVHRHGGFVPAYRHESANNERQITSLKTAIGIIKIIQIAGTFARRIVPYIHTGQYLRKGQRIGIIQFGSRVDLVLPTDKVKVLVKVNDRVLAGNTSIARIIDNCN